MSSTQNNNTTNNNTLSTRITTILVIIFAVGGPSTLSIFGQAFITRHPLRTLLLLIGYVVAIVVIGYVSKVGQELESASTRSVTAWIKFRWQMIFSWYYWQLYRQYVLSEHQVSESSIEAGDRLELKDVFVKPFAKKKALSRISSDPLNTSSVPTL